MVAPTTCSSVRFSPAVARPMTILRTKYDSRFVRVPMALSSETRPAACCGVTEHPFVEPPLNRVQGVSHATLLGKAATLTLDRGRDGPLASR